MAVLEHIETLDDPRISDYVYVREPEWVRRRGLFIVEGELTLRTAIDFSRYPLRSVFVSDRRLGVLGDVFDKLEPNTSVFVAPQEILDGVVGHAVHRGVLAIGERGGRLDVGDVGDAPTKEIMAALPAMRTVLVLERVSNHDNVGGLFRNARAFGVDAVILDGQTADPLYRKAIRVSIGASLVVPFARPPSLPAALSSIVAAGFELWALTPRAPAERLSDLISRGQTLDRVALLLGAEGEGLSEETLARAHRRIVIPMCDGVDSINVASASAVALFARNALAERWF